MQTIATVPDGLMDTAKANSAKNRYQNIHTCESENAEVYDTYNVDTELACSYSLWCSELALSLTYLPSSLTWAMIGIRAFECTNDT